jgi:hypothetical protein
VIFQGQLRLVADITEKSTEFAEFDSNEGDFLGEVPLLLGTPFLPLCEPSLRAGLLAWISSSFSPDSGLR